MIILRLLWKLIRIVWHVVRYSVALALLLILLQRCALPPNDRWDKVAFTVSDFQFDYIGWELDALAAKTGQTLLGLHPYLSEEDRSAIVRDYMAKLARAQSLEAQINAIYTDPDVSDPQSASAGLRAERDTLRAGLRAEQTRVEAILEGQVAAVLVEQGFGVAGQLVPPIAMRFTRVPNLLIVSPRDEIRFDISINLDPMPVDRKAALEARIDEKFDVASLIVPLGGLALYPAMILETTSIPYAVEVYAHEWLHHYLYAFPLGYSYFSDGFAGAARTINETTARLFGEEVGRLVLERYYPDLVPPEPQPEPAPGETPPPEPPAFDYGAEMHETRVHVDELLEAGKVEQAEAYMERRRALFVENGYNIRKLNQAFFAFYGGYQSDSPGVAGDDPIGPAIHAIREASPSLHDFVATMRGITTRDALLAAREELESR